MTTILKEVVKLGHRLGRHIDHDPRSRNFPFLLDPAMKPKSKVWSRSTKPFDQGDIGSCTGNATVGCLATVPLRQRDVTYNEALAVSIYKAATALDDIKGTYPPQDTGSTGLAAAKAAVNRRFASSYRWGFGLNDLVLGVSNLGSAMVGTAWHEGMDTPDSKGLVQITGKVRGGHEYQVIGYHLLADTFECVNSWGPSWGIKGRFFISRLNMGSLLADGGDATMLHA